MTATSQDFECWQGEDNTLQITVKKEDGTPKDISASTAITWKLARKPSAATALLTKSLGSGIAITDGLNGVFQITLSAADLASLYDSYYHEARVKDSANKSKVVTTGKVVVNKSLTIPVP